MLAKRAPPTAAAIASSFISIGAACAGTERVRAMPVCATWLGVSGPQAPTPSLPDETDP